MGPKENHVLARQSGTSRKVVTVEDFKQALVDHLYYERGQGAYTASKNDIYNALVYTIRDVLVENFRKTIHTYVDKLPKFVYYLSAEYLPGKQITQNLLYTQTESMVRQALNELGYDLDELIQLEPEPALGNGGLGRLAACFMDSLATLDIPSVSYGIQYEFGIFSQSFRDGWQVEQPDEWMYFGNSWQFTQPDDRMEVSFGGHTEIYKDEKGQERVRWLPQETVLGEPSHILVPGYNTTTVNMLRLWSARASKEFDFQLFDVGDYARAAEEKIYSENISKVLYPNDNTPQGRELRLKQEYFFVSCSIQDILRRFLSFEDDWSILPEKIVIQLNDTHPVVAIPEFMHQLVDIHGLKWSEAWDITTRVFAYTCHTLMPEALEKWSVQLFERLLPRHMEIIYRINYNFLNEVARVYPDDPSRQARMSLIEEGPDRMVRMAYLATVGSFSVNGVAELHSQLLTTQVFADFYEMWPEKFNNKTNGVSPRRFMHIANPLLSKLIDETIGPSWLNDLERLRELEPYAENSDFREAWSAIKYANKVILTEKIKELTGIQVNPNSMFDVMVKRLHEYKRQHLKTLHIITLYNRLKANPNLDIVPRTFIFGAKAAPGYKTAKLIIKLINSVAEVVNTDPDINGRLKIAFIPNFNVTKGELIYPAAELSEQISMAGKEASGTGNMKFALNGALTIGTLDGANIEIRERVGAENFFLFGLTADEVIRQKQAGYNPATYYQQSNELKAAIDLISSGHFSKGDAGLFRPIVDSLLIHDEYLVLADYLTYITAQDAVDKAYRDQDHWTHMSILNSARCGFFSSDRSMRQYCDDIWDVVPYK